MNEVQKAYQIVLNDIINSGCGLLIGKYDAKNGNKNFMYGIYTAMEFINYKADPTNEDAFDKMFMDNMAKSEEKVEGKDIFDKMVINKKIVGKKTKKVLTNKL